MVVTKKAISIITTALLCVSIVGCTKEDKGNESKYEIGVCQLTQHDALDKAYKGFKDRLEEKGYKDGEKVNIDFKNAQGDFQTAQTISKQFVDSKKDLIFAIATPTAQAAYNSTKDIPIVFTAVTDPVEAKLVESFESTGNNVTGVSDMVPIDRQLDLLSELIKDVKTIGFIYNTSEANSVAQLKSFKEETSKRGILVKEIGITNVNEIDQNLNSAIKDIDVLYTPTDNVVASSYSLVGKICGENKVPVLAAEEAMVDAGGLVTLGIDYYELGREAGNKAIEIIEGKEPKDIKVSTLENLSIKINEVACKKLDIKITDELKEKAKIVNGVNN